MYNLLMRSSWNFDEWEKHQGSLCDVSFISERVLKTSEYTEETVVKKFSSNDGPDWEALKGLPCLFTYEGSDVVGSIGYIREVRFDNRGLTIAYDLPERYPKIRMNKDEVFEALGIGVGNSWERNRTHWAVKDIDLFRVLIELLYREGKYPSALSHDDMQRIWGEGYEGKKLAFISHREEYVHQLSKVKAELDQKGIRCFLAHQDISPTQIWRREILNALDTMDVFLAFVTDDFHGNIWPDQEVGYALHRGVTRVFLKLGDKDPDAMIEGEQALRTDWDTAAQSLIDFLERV